MSLIHNTLFAKGSDWPGLILLSSQLVADYFPVIKSNLMVGEDSTSFRVKVEPGGGPIIQDQITPTGVTHNAALGFADGSEGLGYDKGAQANALWSTGDAATAGVDQTGSTFSNTADDTNAKFVDAGRGILDYHIQGAGESPGTAWSDASVSYSAGDIVSTTFLGRTVNWSAKFDHTSGATTEPGVGSAWEGQWEPATYALIQADPTIIPTVRAWIEEGYETYIAAYEDAGHDSVTIGSQPYAGPAPGPSIPGGPGDQRVWNSYFLKPY
jgi:hypothetical protein